MFSRRAACLLGSGALVIGGSLAGLVLSAGPAGAQACDPATSQSSCEVAGTLTVGSGTLGVESSATLGWGATLTGTDQQIVDTNASEQFYQTVDATGLGAGWNVTVSASQFGNATDATTLPNTGTFVTNGSLTDETDATPPAAACATGSTCTPPVLSGAVTFPVAITTDGTPAAIYDANAGTGQGVATISPVGWWLNVPSNATVGDYTSVITLAINAGPV